jgi:hypothetical protein
MHLSVLGKLGDSNGVVGGGSRTSDVLAQA